MPEDVVSQLGKVELFSNLPARHLKRVAKLVEIREAQEGDVLVREGTFTRDFFIILAGTASVSVRGRVRDTMAKGEHFGELAIIGKTSRTATVTAKSPMRLGVIGARALEDLLKQEPTIALHLLQTLVRRFEYLATGPRGRLSR